MSEMPLDVVSVLSGFRWWGSWPQSMCRRGRPARQWWPTNCTKTGKMQMPIRHGGTKRTSRTTKTIDYRVGGISVSQYRLQISQLYLYPFLILNYCQCHLPRWIQFAATGRENISKNVKDNANDYQSDEQTTGEMKYLWARSSHKFKELMDKESYLLKMLYHRVRLLQKNWLHWPTDSGLTRTSVDCDTMVAPTITIVCITCRIN